MELYLKYRPKTLDEVVGQKEAIRTLQTFVDKRRIPHAILFSGSSGCGKTTLARIMAKELKCHDHELRELDCADLRGIDNVRDIKRSAQLNPMFGKVLVWIIDEAHKLTNDAQNAMLKILEDTPKHVYLFIATTQQTGLITTLVSRCTIIKVVPLSQGALGDLLEGVAKKEKIKLTEDVKERILEFSFGSARTALVYLNQIMDLKTEEAQLNAIIKGDQYNQAIEIARALMERKPSWHSVAKIIGNIKEDPESIRHLVLGYCSKILLSGKPGIADKAYIIINAFRDNWYDCKKAGLIAACWEVVCRK